MKKILSILLALGLVLGMVVTALPAMADVSEATVVPDPDCEFEPAEYTIVFDIEAALHPGSNRIYIEFPEGTGFPANPDALDITVFDGVTTADVFDGEKWVAGTTLSFMVPFILADGAPVTVVIDSLINPATGTYNVVVWTDRPADSTPVESDDYFIRPAVSTYAWNLNFGPAYPGIAPNFIPPFKACGQDPEVEYNLSPNPNPFVSYPGVGGAFVTPFDLALVANPVGCQPCPRMAAYLQMTGRPAGGVATLYDIPAVTVRHTFNALAPGAAATHALVTPAVTLDPIPDPNIWSFDLGFHFSAVGTYTFDLVLDYTGTGQCELGCVTVVRELEFVVHQQKDAFAIPLEEKWNLISLPLVPFDSDIDVMLASLPAARRARIQSIWNYDALVADPADRWFVSGNGQTSLTDIVDGKSYWFRLNYPLPIADPGPYYWWVWGTEKPQPPYGPAEYEVATGWNMVGFTSLMLMAADDYLWNWIAPPTPVIYGWEQGAWNVQGWDLLAFGTDDLEPGQGYWMAFPRAGYIYVPTP